MPANEVFICYRRRENAGYARSISEHVTRHLGEEAVFRDVDRIEGGVDFVEEIERALATCRAFVLVMGAGWLSSLDEKGRRQLDDPNDYVILEIATALKAGIRVIPVLIDGARMPAPEQLPATIAPIARRHAIEITDSRFDHDIGRLLRAISAALNESSSSGGGGAQPPPRPEPPRPPPPPPIPIRLSRSYFSVVLCLPLGIMAVSESNKCAAALSVGDTSSALTASKAAQKWNTLALPASFVFWPTLFTVLCVAASR